MIESQLATRAPWFAGDVGLMWSHDSGSSPRRARLIEVLVASLALLVSTGLGCGSPSVGSNDSGLDAEVVCPPYEPVFDSPVPVRMDGLDGVVDVAAGWENACAVTSTGEVYCWGSNCHSQLGDGTTSNSATPVRVLGLPPARSIAVRRGGMVASCAVTYDDEAWCWGWTDWGLDATPIPLEGLDTVTQLCTGWRHMCTLDAAGNVRCLGANYANQLGLGEDGPAYSPTLVSPLGGHQYKSVHCGGQTTCAITTEDVLHCWGGTPEGYVVAPSLVEPVPAVLSLHTGDLHDCLLDTDRNAWCWGWNVEGQAGYGEYTLSEQFTRFTQHLDVADASELAAGNITSCALHQDGTVSCWGGDFNGERGDGEETHVSNAVPSTVFGLENAVKISAGRWLVCAITADGSLWCWGRV